MKPTDILREEHELILAMRGVIESVIERIEAEEKSDTGHLADIVDFIRNFADGCRHAKEENLRFPDMEETGIGRVNDPIGVMRAEHEAGQDFAREMDRAVKQLKEGDASAAGIFAGAARGYINLLDAHIMKENTILFKMADDTLTAARQEELSRGFERIEREDIGEGVHERYHELLHVLRDRYLPAA